MSQLASSVNTQQEDRVIRKIPVGAIMTLAVLGVTARGPIGSSVLTLDAPDWKTTFGGHTADGDSVLIAEAYFNNGGTRLRQSRVVHHTDSTDPNTKTSTKATATLETAATAPTSGSVTSSNAEPFALASGDDLDIDINGAGPATATFTGTPATITAGNAENYALVDGQNLTVIVNGGPVQTATFNTAEFAAIGAATAAEVAAVLAAELTGVAVDVTGGAPRLTSDLAGTDATIEVTGGTANAVLGFSTTPVSGGGNVGDISAVTGAEAKTIIEAAVANSLVTVEPGGEITIASTTTGGASTVLVAASSTADDEFGLDNATHTGSTGAALNTLRVDAKWDGTYGNAITVTVAAATSGEADEFNLTVLEGGIIVETWENLSMTDADPNYVETKINHETTGSNYIAVVDLDASTTSPSDLPATGTFGPLAGGGDGLVGLADTDFVGGNGPNGNVGLRTFDPDTDIDVLVVDRATSTVHNGMITYCDIAREGLIFAILNPPMGLDTQGMANYVANTASLFNATENAAIYWPNVKIANPNKPVYGNDDLLVVPPAGHIAGVYARVDASKVGGMFEQPAGSDAPFLPRGIEGFENDEVLELKNREILFPLNINPISKEDGPIFIDGARNLDITGNWPSVGQRRGVMFVEKRLRPGLAFLRHRNQRPRLYSDGRQAVFAFLRSLTDAGAFKSKDPASAFSVDFGPALNTASVQAQRTVKARVGLATAGPAEFINVLIGPDSDDLAAQLAALAA